MLTLALGIGANSAIFALADATLLRPLPFTAPDRLMAVWERRNDTPRIAVNPADFADWSEGTRTFASMAAFLQSPRALTAADGAAESVPGQAVTPRFFDVLGVKPIAGRTFVPADETAAPTSVVLSEAFWRSRFGGDPTLVGRQIRIDDAMFTVIGVVPADFNLDGAGTRGRSRLWTLLTNPRGRGPEQRYAHYLRVIGRLKPGVAPEAAEADLNAIAESLARELATNQGHSVMIEPLRAGFVTPELRLTSILLAGVVGFLLLMCCANVANLLLARTAVRARELAVRSALGAGRMRIVRQMLVEGLVLAVLGGVAGACVGAAILLVVPFVDSGGVAARCRVDCVRRTRAGLLRGDVAGSHCGVRSRPGVAGDGPLACAGRHTRWPGRDATGLGIPKRAGNRTGRRRGAAVVRGGAAAAYARHGRAGRSRPSRPERADDDRQPRDGKES